MPTTTATVTPHPPISCHVYTDQPLQLIQDVAGGNFIHETGGTYEPIDSITAFNLERLKSRYARVRIVLSQWEPENDDDDPANFNWAGFKDYGYNHATFELLKELKERNVNLTASIWRTPNWMVTNPAADSQRLLDPQKYAEVIESIAAWLVWARDQYGVEIDYVSFNESDGGYSTLVPPTAYVQLIKMGGERFAELGLPTKWYLGDTCIIKNVLPYVIPIWAEQSIRQYLGPLTFHSWDAEVSDTYLENIGNFADREGLEVWATETGWNSELWRTPQKMSSWEHALKLGMIYARMIKLSRASVFMYWQMTGHDYNINDGNAAYPAFTILQQLSEILPPGSQVLATDADTPTMHYFAAQAPGHFVIYLVNMAKKPANLSISGIPSGWYHVILNNETQTGQRLENLHIVNESTLLQIPPQSILYLTTVINP